MKAIYSIDDSDFVDETPDFKESGYIIEIECKETGKTILGLYDDSGNNPLHLHNQDGYSTLVLDYFREKDVRFMLYVDYFCEDNRHLMPSNLSNEIYSNKF